MQASTRGLNEAERILKIMPTISKAAFAQIGIEMAASIYKRVSTQQDFLESWNYAARFYFFCNNEDIRETVQRQINIINHVQSKAQMHERYGLPHEAPTNAELDAMDLASKILDAMNLPSESYIDVDGLLKIDEIIFTEEQAIEAAPVIEETTEEQQWMDTKDTTYVIFNADNEVVTHLQVNNVFTREDAEHKMQAYLTSLPNPGFANRATDEYPSDNLIVTMDVSDGDTDAWRKANQIGDIVLTTHNESECTYTLYILECQQITFDDIKHTGYFNVVVFNKTSLKKDRSILVANSTNPYRVGDSLVADNEYYRVYPVNPIVKDFKPASGRFYL